MDSWSADITKLDSSFRQKCPHLFCWNLYNKLKTIIRDLEILLNYEKTLISNFNFDLKKNRYRCINRDTSVISLGTSKHNWEKLLDKIYKDFSSDS